MGLIWLVENSTGWWQQKISFQFTSFDLKFLGTSKIRRDTSYDTESCWGKKGIRIFPLGPPVFGQMVTILTLQTVRIFSSPKCFAYLQLLQTEIKRGWCLYCITIVQRQSCSSKWPLCSFKLFPHVLLRMTRVLPCSASSVCSRRKLDYISMQWLHSQDYLVSPFIFPVSTFPL